MKIQALLFAGLLAAASCELSMAAGKNQKTKYVPSQQEEDVPPPPPPAYEEAPPPAYEEERTLMIENQCNQSLECFVKLGKGEKNPNQRTIKANDIAFITVPRQQLELLIGQGEEWSNIKITPKHTQVTITCSTIIRLDAR